MIYLEIIFLLGGKKKKPSILIYNTHKSVYLQGTAWGLGANRSDRISLLFAPCQHLLSSCENKKLPKDIIALSHPEPATSQRACLVQSVISMLHFALPTILVLKVFS